MKTDHTLNRPLNRALNRSDSLFTDPAILEQIGPRRLAKFLDAFTGDLASLNLAAPVPSIALRATEGPPVEPMTDDYFSKTAAFLSDTHALPTRLVSAMRTLETAAAAENATSLDTLIQRHIPNVSLNRSCPLDCALELWFTSPELLNGLAS